MFASRNRRFDSYFAVLEAKRITGILSRIALFPSMLDMMPFPKDQQGLRIRIATGFSLVIALTLFIAGWSYYNITSLGNTADNLFIDNYRSIQYAERMQHLADEIGSTTHLASTPNPAVLLALDAQFKEAISEEYRNITETGELEVAKSIENEYLDLYRSIESAAPSQIIESQLKTTKASISSLVKLNEDAMFRRADEIKDKAEFARTSSLVISLLLGATAIFLAVAVSRRSFAEFQELDRAKSNFVATAAHELKNPLTSIKTSTGLLVDGVIGPLASGQREILQSVKHEADRLLTLVNELLDLAKLETGTLTLTISEQPVDVLIESAMTPVLLQAQLAHVEMDVHMPMQLPTVFVDANKITWALANLLTNAIRVSPRGSQVHIGASEIDHELWISVTDQGKGIAEKDLKRIFEKFVQVEDASLGRGTGSGLGLSIAKEIVLAHKGRIWASSEPGKGATFTIALPLKTTTLKHYV